ncbi:MAG TPA: hypothetical protein DCG39_07920 [Opitutae bacterium]|nr:hypothetical protein [Opitutae bacterium]
MDYYEGVVREFLDSNRSVFLNERCLINLDGVEYRVNGKWPAGRHWYCDAVAVNLETQTVQLCEVTYSKTLGSLMKRLTEWAHNWTELRAALVRDNHVHPDWRVEPRAFFPRRLREVFDKKLTKLSGLVGEQGQMPVPMVDYLEDIVPWKYKHY